MLLKVEYNTIFPTEVILGFLNYVSNDVSAINFRLVIKLATQKTSVHKIIYLQIWVFKITQNVEMI